MTANIKTFDMDTAKLIAEATVEAVLAAGNVGDPTGNPQLNAILGLLLQERKEFIEWRKKQEEQFRKFEAELAENTKVTKAVESTVAAGKLLTWGIKWIAGIALAVSTLYTVFYMATHGGALPGSSGPVISPTP